MTVVFTVRVLTSTGIIFSVGRTFDDGETRQGDEAGLSTFSTDGVYVLDPAEGTRHLVAYDSEGQPEHLVSVIVPAEDSERRPTYVAA